MSAAETTETEVEAATAAVAVFHRPPGSHALTIFERLAAIVAEMPAIGKTTRNEQQQFMYRGHDDVMNALNPLLSKYGVFFVPKVLERLTDQRSTRSGSVLYEVNLLVEYTFYGPRGDSVTASAWGEGTDSGDKSTNKAMTMALKNVLAQTFAVSTEEQSKLDTDGNTDEATVGRASAPAAGKPKMQRKRGAANVTDPRAKAFDPAKHLAAGAPAGWDEIQALILDLDLSIGEWVSEAVVKLYGSRVADLDDEKRSEAGKRIANVLTLIRDELYADGDFPPPSDDEYRPLFKWAFGVDVDGPGAPFATDAAQADAAAPESGSDAPGDPEPLQEDQHAYDGLGDQAHIGTAAPDE